jgi:hypothetical protein
VPNVTVASAIEAENPKVRMSRMWKMAMYAHPPPPRRARIRGRQRMPRAKTSAAHSRSSAVIPVAA